MGGGGGGGGGAFRDGLGCGGEGGVGPTRVWYLLGVRAVAPRGWEAGAAEEEPTTALPLAATGAAAGGAAAAGAV